MSHQVDDQDDNALMQDDDDHDDDDHDEMDDLHAQRRRMSDVLLDSWRYVEVAALTIPDSLQHHAIGARLGGTNVDSTRLHSSPNIGRQRRSSNQTTPFTSPMVTSRSMRAGTTTTTTGAIDEKTKLLSQAAEQLKQEYGGGDEVEEQLQTPPKLTQWIGVALACAICYALYNISIKKGSATIHPILGGVILQFVAAILGVILLFTMIYMNQQAEDKIHYDRNGILWSLCAGLWVGTAEMVSFYVSSIGVPATQFIPIIIGGSVLFGSIIGTYTLGETILCRGWSGVVLLCIGIGSVATDHNNDPGSGEEKVQESGSGGDNEDCVEDLEIAQQQPPLLVWIGPALFCALAYALYNICIKKGSASINPIVGAVILQFVAALYGTCILLVIVVITVNNNNSPPPAYDRHGILWACWAGIFVGMAELLSFCVSGMGVQASQSIPIIIGGSVGFGAVLGILMLHEELEIIPGWSGVLLLMTGIALVATDPGEKVEGH